MSATTTAQAVELLKRAAELLGEALERDAGDRGMLRFHRACQWLDAPPPTVRQWIRAGWLTPTKIGRAVYLSVDDLWKFVEEHREPADPDDAEE